MVGIQSFQQVSIRIEGHLLVPGIQESYDLIYILVHQRLSSLDIVFFDLRIRFDDPSEIIHIHFLVFPEIDLIEAVRATKVAPIGDKNEEGLFVGLFGGFNPAILPYPQSDGRVGSGFGFLSFYRYPHICSHIRFGL